MKELKIFPAIDLKEGKCVRLVQGDFDKQTIFSNEPEKQAKIFLEQGAKFLHVVDLDGALLGESGNLPTIKKILNAVESKLFVEVGGGIRTMKTIETMLELGVNRVVLGSVAIENPQLVKEACEKFGEKIAVGLDVLDGKVAIHGWKNVSDIDVFDCAEQMKNFGVKTIIYTDISKDGMLAGANHDVANALAEKFPEIEIVLSGGVHSVEDIQTVRKMGKIAGVIVGKALYTGKISLGEIL